MNKVIDTEMNRRTFLQVGSRVMAAGVLALTAGVHLQAIDSIAGGGFRVDPNDFRKILKIGVRYGAEFSELFLEQRMGKFIELTDGTVTISDSSASEGAGVRLIKNGAIGYHHTESLKQSDLKRTARAARDQVPRTSKDVDIPEFNQKPEHFRGAIFAVNPVEKVPENECRNVLQEIYSHVKKTSNLIETVTLRYQDEARWTLLCNSMGLFRIDYQPTISLIIEVTAKQGVHRFTARRSLCHRAGFELFQSSVPRNAAGIAAEEAVEMLAAQSIAPGRTSVIFESGAAGPLFEAILTTHLRADRALDGTSPWAGFRGSEVASPELTLVDDGRYPRVAGTSHIDDEGTLTGKTTLIENGVLKGFLTDQLTAGRLKMSLTGNSRRGSYEVPPGIHPTNTHILPGQLEPSEILESTSRGIYIRGLAPGQADSGQWVFPVTTAFMINDGTLTHGVTNMALVCGATDFLSKVDRIGNNFDMRPVDGSVTRGIPRAFGNPTMRIRNLTLRKI